MTDKNLTPMQSFEEKIKARLTKDIGDLIPNEALVGLIEKASHSVFFEDQRVVTNAGDWQKEKIQHKDSIFKEIVKELLAERMDTAIREWIESNRDVMTIQLKEFIETSAEEAIMKGIRTMFFGSFDMMKNDVLLQVSNQFNNHQQIY